MNRPLSSPGEMDAFAFFAQRMMGKGDRNAGERAVLALAQVNDWVANVDDAEAKKAADEAPGGPIRVRRTLAVV